MLPKALAKKKRILSGGVPRIDWSNPLTNGLTACYVPGNTATTGTIKNLTGTGCDLVTVGANTVGLTAEGQGFKCAAANATGAWGTATNAMMQPANLTLYFRGTVTAYNTNADIPLFGVSYGNADAGPYISYALDCNNSAVGASFGTSNGFTAGDSQTLPLNNKVLSLGATFSAANAMFYYNGTNTVTQSMTGNILYTTNSQVNLMGYHSNPNRYMQGIALVAYMWNRVLSPAEMEQLDADPYGFLVFAEDKLRATAMGITRFSTVESADVMTSSGLETGVALWTETSDSFSLSGLETATNNTTIRKQYMWQGIGYMNESLHKVQYMIPGWGFINETAIPITIPISAVIKRARGFGG